MRHLIAAATCLIATSGAVTSAAATDQASGLLRLWRAADGACTDPRGSASTIDAACARQKAVAARLQRVDWCLGREGELSHRYTWHRCATGSYNADGTNYAAKVSARL